MKIEVLPFKAMAKCNEHMNHNGFSIDLGEDVIHVVRCKDCRHWVSHSTREDRRCCFIFGGYVTSNDYCSRGEKRVENEK